jgi:hypothetical protein
MNCIKPPDKYRTIKCSFKQIIKNTNYGDIIFDAIIRTHKLVTHTYQFLRLFILHNYEKKTNIIDISEDVIKMVFKTLTESSQGPKPKGNNLVLFNKFNDFLSIYQKLNFKDKIDGRNLSSILGYMATDMITNIENNIKLNFISYIKRFVNSSFRKLNNEIIDKAPKGTKTKLRKELYKDLYDIKQDIIDNTLLSNNKYHAWINQHKNNIRPNDIVNSLDYDITNNPQKYLKSMIYMCLELEKLEVKSFQFFPLRNNIIPKYISIDTKSIVELLVDEDKNTYLNDIEGYKDILWSKYFNFNDNVFRQKHYNFNFMISTDCYGASIQLIHNTFIEKEKDKKAKMKNMKRQIRENCKDMKQDEKDKYRNELKLKKIKEQKDFKLKVKQEKDKMKAEFKKLPKEEKEKIKLKMKKKENEKYVEFPYLEELNKSQLEKLKNNNWLCIDPGKSNLLYMKNKNGLTMNYSNRNHVRNTKRIKYQKLLKNYKDKKKITKLENKLADYNSKTCNFKKFSKFVKYKNGIYDKLFVEYKKDIFRKYKWYGHINKKRAEDNLVNKIKKTYGKDTIINFGDWSVGKSMRACLSTPNLSLKRKIAQHFTVYNLDEFRTSKLNCKNETKNENLSLPDKKGKSREIHSILTYQMESQRMGCINRDENAVNNMIKLVKYYLQFKERPEKFRRDYKFPE